MRHAGASLGGFVFTVSLFVSNVAFRGFVIYDAKSGVLAASALAAVIGTVVVRLVLRR
jgi:Na+/H+ antiporter NhaA